MPRGPSRTSPLCSVDAAVLQPRAAARIVLLPAVRARDIDLLINIVFEMICEPAKKERHLSPHIRPPLLRENVVVTTAFFFSHGNLPTHAY
jgi:hypothetical protein